MENSSTLFLALWIGALYLAHALFSVLILIAHREPSHWRQLMGQCCECAIIFLLISIGGLHIVDASPLWATSAA